MYSVTKRIEFCYGHRLLDYDGICKHPHGHNAVAEIEVRTDSLDSRNMVVDFSDIKQEIKGWIDDQLDHKMILRHDDPLVNPAAGARRANLPARQQPDRRAHRAPHLRHHEVARLRRGRRPCLGDPLVLRHVRGRVDAGAPRRLRPRRHARRFTPRPGAVGQRPDRPGGRAAAGRGTDRAHGRRRRVAPASSARSRPPGSAHRRTVTCRSSSQFTTGGSSRPPARTRGSATCSPESPGPPPSRS